MRQHFQIEVGAGLDIIGDIHGCFDEFMQLLKQLGYEEKNGLFIHPQGRKLVSVGDITSRGPKSIAALKFFIAHKRAGLSYMTDSNHGWKIARWLDGRKVQLTHGDDSVATEFTDYEIKHGTSATDKLKQESKELLLEAPSHYILMQNGKEVAVVTHAGIKDHYIGQDNSKIRDFTRYGDVRGTDKKTGRPIRYDWFLEHKSPHIIIWGHDPKLETLFTHNTVNIDQGCVFGGKLTALRFPEMTTVSVEGKHDFSYNPDNSIALQKDGCKGETCSCLYFIEHFQTPKVCIILPVRKGSVRLICYSG